MTAPHGQVPQAKASPNGRRPAPGRRPGEGARPRRRRPVPRPEVPVPEHEDLAASAAHHAGGAEGVLWHGHGPFTGFGFRQAAGILRYAGAGGARAADAAAGRIWHRP